MMEFIYAFVINKLILWNCFHLEYIDKNYDSVKAHLCISVRKLTKSAIPSLKLYNHSMFDQAFHFLTVC